MKNLIVFAAVLLVAFIGIGLVYGWIEYQRSEDKTTIDIHTQEMKQDVEQAADKAVVAGRKLLEETGEALESKTTKSKVADDADVSVGRAADAPPNSP